MSQTILVTGASGALGRAVVSALGETARQGLRNLSKAAVGVDAVRFDYADPATFRPALDGAHGLFLMAPPLDPDAPAKLAPVVAAAKDAGVRHIVFVSAFGVNHNEQAPLRLVEHMVTGSGIAYTILRPNFFMENFRHGHEISLAAGDAKISFISVRDVAAVTLEAFHRPLAGQELDLTGPEALDHHEVARILSTTYHAISEDEMVDGARAAGMPEPNIHYLKMLYAIVRAGDAAGITTDVERILGRKPVRFAEAFRS
jgi:uncharacterized protein YbjT (DUF2867 family)